MVGTFKDGATAETVKNIIEKFTETLQTEEAAGLHPPEKPTDRFSDKILDLIDEVNVRSLDSTDLQQFLYDFDVKRRDNSVVITTDEVDVQALIKVLVEKDAKVEIYSRHAHPDTADEPGE
ncbi:DUF6375 family protein [Micromonospora zamorensis]|uniref:DUF6375 family protein n=1 Tax=Micromonospora zamorensis TaxID=709883 RepID=UPI0033F0FB8E